MLNRGRALSGIGPDFLIGIGHPFIGKVGQLIYRQTKYGTVVYEAPSKATTISR